MRGRTSRAGQPPVIAGPRLAASRSRLDEVQVLAPTALEYWAARSLRPAVNVVRSGVSLSRRPDLPGDAVILCGIAGGLEPELAPGTVVIPHRVGLADGRIFVCDEVLVQALTAGARSLGFEPDPRPIVTSPTFVRGPDRDYWSRRGFIAADMETGLLAERGLRVATVRVVLDSPSRDITDTWMRPGHAGLRVMDLAGWPSLLAEFFWLCRVGPWYSVRAARILRAALGSLSEVPDA